MNKKIIAAILAVAALSIAAVVGYFSFERRNFVKTDDARVAAETIVVAPEIAGKLVEWRVREGDTVGAGELLGEQDLGAVLSGAQSSGAMGVINAEKATIVSPIDGLVIQSSAVVGQMAAPGGALAVLANTGSLYVAANIKEGDIAKVAVGEPVAVEIDAFHGKVFHGRVSSVGRATASAFSLLPEQSGGGNYTKVIQVIPIKVALVDAADARLMVGMNAYVSISVNGK